MKFLPLFILLLVTACGFTPVYNGGGTTSTTQSLNKVEVMTIPNREGQIVRNHLIDRLYDNGYPANPQYRLSVSPINENTVKMGIDRDDEASRAQLRLYTSMTLWDNVTNKAVLKRQIQATTGYNILAGQFTTYVTKEDARKQGLRMLSDDIMTQLELYFNR